MCDSHSPWWCVHTTLLHLASQGPPTPYLRNTASVDNKHIYHWPARQTWSCSALIWLFILFVHFYAPTREPLTSSNYIRLTQLGLSKITYDLYLIHYDYFELLRLYYNSLHILSSLIAVEYDTIWLQIQYDMVVVFNHNNNILKCHRSAQFWCRSDLYVLR